MSDLISRETLLKYAVRVELANGNKGWVIEKGYVEDLPAVEPQEWIPVKDRLPDSEVEVEICALRKGSKSKKYIITTAMYEDGTIRDNDSRWNWENIDWAGWDDEEDCGIIPEGWWEYRHYNPDDVYNNPIDDEVVAWRELPNPYKGE